MQNIPKPIFHSFLLYINELSLSEIKVKTELIGVLISLRKWQLRFSLRYLTWRYFCIEVSDKLLKRIISFTRAFRWTRVLRGLITKIRVYILQIIESYFRYYRSWSCKGVRLLRYHGKQSCILIVILEIITRIFSYPIKVVAFGHHYTGELHIFLSCHLLSLDDGLNKSLGSLDIALLL